LLEAQLRVKDFEEFFTDNETLDMQRFNNLGVIKNELNVEEDKLHVFEEKFMQCFQISSGIKKKLLIYLTI
jgi:hypothetical protein